jgi:hypothetical protein
MNVREYLMASNAWITQEKRCLFVDDVYVTQDLSKWKKYDILLSTSENDHLLEYKTLIKILEVMPEIIHWDGKFALGIKLDKESWKTQIKEEISNKNGKICFLNFVKHKLTKSEFEIYMENELKKKHKIDELLRNKNSIIVNKEKEKIISSRLETTDPNKFVMIGCPPKKCNILITRSDFVDAIPESSLNKYVKENGIIVHFGRLKCMRDTMSPTYIDSCVLFGENIYTDWAKCMNDYIKKLNSCLIA